MDVCLTGIDDQEVLFLMRVDMANTGEEETCDGVLVTNGGHESTFLQKERWMVDADNELLGMSFHPLDSTFAASMPYRLCHGGM